MKFKGTIIITDPCYIMRDYEETYPKFETWPGLEGVSQSTKFGDYTEEQMRAYRCYEKACRAWEEEYDDWDKCYYGENMEALGIHNYITESTIYGDWGCTTYKIKENPYEVVDNLVEASEKGDDYGVKYSKLGDFCADSGKVSVFLLNEVRKYNLGIDEWIASHDWCVTTIPDFDGEVNYYIDKQGNAHIVGIGNINFFTTQTSL